MTPKVYTKTGDKGETSLFGGKRVSKADLRVESYGTIDHLNAIVGITLAEISNVKFPISNIQKELLHIQKDLFEIGTLLANPDPKAESKKERIEILKKRTAEFEKLIDKLTIELPDFQCFILPGVGKVGSHLHLCRTACRTAERRIVALSKKAVVDQAILMYCNRLSDLFFTMARYANLKEKKKETIWH